MEGPVDMTSIEKHLYFLILVDDVSGLLLLTRCKRDRMLSHITEDLPNKHGTKQSKELLWHPIVSRIDLQVQASQHHTSSCLEPILMCLDFKSTGVVHFCMFPQKREKLRMFIAQNAS